MKKNFFTTGIIIASCGALLTVAGCAGAGSTTETQSIEETTSSVAETEMVTETTGTTAAKEKALPSPQTNETVTNSEDGGHAIYADGTKESYSNVRVEKTGEADGDEADFYGENAAIFAENGATLDLKEMDIETDGTHANAVFSYGEGTTVNISDSVINTKGNCSGGLMTTGGGTMNADNLLIHTTGNSSAAIRSDRGGGTVNVTNGNYTTDGTGSPVIYSTADITVSDAKMESTASQGIVIEGKNSVTLNDVELVADNNTKNSDKSDYYQAVMIYQSMSGDAAEGLSSFTVDGGSITNKNGDVIFVNNTVTEISLNDVNITNEDTKGAFLRAAAAGWGSEGSNGGQVTLTATDQVINGDMLVDEVSNLNLYLTKSSVFTGAVNPDGEEGEVYVELDADSKWVLTSDSYITGLTCEAGAIDLNGHTLYVNGVAYDGSASTGEAIEAVYSSSGGSGGPGGSAPEGGPGGEPPARP